MAETAPGPEPPRNELLLKLFFGARVSPAVSRDHVVSCMAAHERTLKVYAAMSRQLQKDQPNDPQLPYWLMTLSFGRHRSAALVKWSKETLKELERLDRAT